MLGRKAFTQGGKMLVYLRMTELYQIKERKYKYPHQINKVPVQTYFFDHFIMAATLVCAGCCTVKNQKS